MLNIPIVPKVTSHGKKPRSAASITAERIQNIKMQELGIDPYEYDTDKEYTDEEQELINEALKLITLNQDVPKELADKVKEITNKG